MTQTRAKEPVLAGVVGHPISHSLSPLIHAFWAKRAGIDGYYIPLDVAPTYDDFARAMDGLRAIGFAGVNVTLPHKEHALRYADGASAEAKSAGAANVLTFAGPGVEAHNSDIVGFAAAVREQYSAPGQKPPAGPALILGAGGAARGVALALKELGVAEIAVANRTREKAEALAETFGLQVVDWAKRGEAVETTRFLVNTTSLGMSGEPPLDVDLSGLSREALVADIVYAPLETPLLKTARAQGNKTVDGLAMLMQQAVYGFNKWFGGKGVVDADLRAALEAELARRSA